MASSAPLSKANTTFSVAMFRQLRDDNSTSNIFFSPFSISSSLAMVMLGARANTLKQISECLKTQDCQDDVHTSFAQLLRELNKSGAPFALSVANRLYGEQSYKFVKNFLAQTRMHYDAELESVDFKNRSEEARVKINSWVEKQTQGKIQDVVAKGGVNDMTRLVLVNAIYFKGEWSTRFETKHTRTGQFRLNKNATVPVQMMEQRSHFPLTYISEVRCQILEMPYKGKELSMLIILPEQIADDTTGLKTLEEQLTYENFVEWTDPHMMDNVSVQVCLPRFKMEETYEMNHVLSSMGMEDAFDVRNCDFSGMTDNKELFLSKVTHKAFVEVNEEGTEAAAATASFGFMMGRSAFRPARFIADHPFLFFIRHNTTMSVLFAGRFCSPV